MAKENLGTDDFWTSSEPCRKNCKEFGKRDLKLDVDAQMKIESGALYKELANSAPSSLHNHLASGFTVVHTPM